MSNLWKFFKDEEWAMFVAVLMAVVAQLPALGNVIAGEMSKAGDSFSWQGLLLVAAGVITRFNVWAKDTVDKVKAAQLPPGTTVIGPKGSQ